MAVYYKFKSARDYDSIPMDGPFISVGTLKEKIFESKHLGRGTDFDLLVTNAQTNEEYLDEAMLIPKNTSVLIRRVPGRPRMPIVTEQDQKVGNKVEEAELEKSSLPAADTFGTKYPEESEWDEFGNDLYAIPDVVPVQASNSLPDAPPTNKADEDSKIKALIDTPALDWQRQGPDGYGTGRGFGRGMGGRMGGGRGFGLERKTPPQGYICHRCKVPGHFIQHCPTNGDPTYDIKRVKPPTGIPKSMLMATPDGSYALPSGAVAVLKPNEDAFEKEMEGLPSTRSIGDLPPELHCPLCKEVMKDAVLTSKCCFKSFCDRCIRDYIISKSMCICGATNILADDLLPNKTLRDTISRILESGNSSAENAGSIYQVPDMEASRAPQPKIPSPTMSAASKGEQKASPSPANIGTAKIQEAVNDVKAVSAPQQTLEKLRLARTADLSEATHESMSVREQASQGSAQLVEEEVQQKMAPGDAGKKKKKKKLRAPANDFQWKISQDFGPENYMMPMGPSSYNPYWGGMQPGMEGFMPPYSGAMPYAGYGMPPLDMPFGPVLPQDPFSMTGYMFPVPPQRGLAEFNMGMNVPPPIMSREEFEARKADLRRKRENERRGENRDFPKDREFGREVSSVGDVSSLKSRPKPILPSSSADYHHHHCQRSERSPPNRSPHDLEPPRPAKRKSEHHRDRDRERDYDYDRDRELAQDYGHHDHDRHHHRHHRSESSSRPSSEPVTKASSTAAAAAAAAAAAERKKASVFSRISFPEGEVNKKRKLSTPTEGAGASASASASSAHHKSTSNGYYDDYKSGSLKGVPSGGGGRKSSTVDYESSDDERHFKRRPSRYEPSPPPPQAEWEEDSRHSRGSRERKHK
ncbi:DWNN domain, A CCHC-type zinc finger protein [Quillaja saponaria]|uniref:DWNN domain, A CCHC-type zinc finger protein n=1 Tax=Quillaja saponaria TaxID=32244 RepID=A0AAD7L7E5_QUISA|nr:DWNN domain, A CCHC-type zinc finger protein [Quillaja saponaria]